MSALDIVGWKRESKRENERGREREREADRVHERGSSGRSETKEKNGQ